MIYIRTKQSDTFLATFIVFLHGAFLYSKKYLRLPSPAIFTNTPLRIPALLLLEPLQFTFQIPRFNLRNRIRRVDLSIAEYVISAEMIYITNMFPITIHQVIRDG